MNEMEYPLGVEVTGKITPEFASILTSEALSFVAGLARRFEVTRQSLLRQRLEREKTIKAGAMPDFLPETAAIRQADWTIAGIPADLLNRRVEITGPGGDRKMVINALNSGASTFMADFEDALSPTWENIIQSQINLHDAIFGSIGFTSPDGKTYQLAQKTAVLIARPRGWHLVEKHVKVDGYPVSASIFDFALYFFHNARQLLANGSGPYYYLPKMESHLEARLWNDIFVEAQKTLGLPAGTIKVTVLIETILAAFEMDEILFELKDHIVGLNCGRWDYIFSFIKKMRFNPAFILPDRSLVTMTVPFMRDYSLLTIRTCHRRRAYAVGGMAAQIPIRGDAAANDAALAKVRDDKIREVKNGHDGTWVAHPALVPVALQAFNENMPGINQLDILRTDVNVTAKDLLAVPDGPITEQGLRINISIGIRYLAAWLSGSGAVPLNNLMEDAATAEISRAQIWQWIRNPKGILADGRKVTLELYSELLAEELCRLESTMDESSFAASRLDLASHIFTELTLDDEFAQFLTIRAYEFL
jgi:malate synthase